MDSNAKATILAASIGGVCVFLAALIGLFNPVMGKIAEQIFPSPTFTPIPTATFLPSPVFTLVPTALPSATPDPSVLFFAYNNFEHPQDLYVDGQLEAAVDSGAYATFPGTRGSHSIQNCPRGENPRVNPADCVGVTYDVNADPFFWQLPGNVAPTGNSSLIVNNVSDLDIDFFVDGRYTVSVPHTGYKITPVPVGQHTFQACPQGFNPTANPTNCGTQSRYDIEIAIEFWTITN